MTTTDHDALTLLGSPVRGSIDADALARETFTAPRGIGPVRFRSAELTAFCPVTGQPDLYDITITYQPAGRCIESKALKMYLHGFRDTARFAEALAATIRDDIVKAVGAVPVTVTLVQQVRGGLTLTATAHHGPGARL